MRSTDRRDSITGILYGVAAYGTWGMFPLFWRLLEGVSYYRILVHRVVWAAVFFILLLLLKRGRSVVATLRSSTRHTLLLTLSGLLIVSNWLVYIYAVMADRIVEASLGYFINPLMNVFLGMIFLRERLRPAQWAAVALAAFGVARLGSHASSFPWISIWLALSFALYALLRKRLDLEPSVASTTESLIMAVPGLLFLLFLPESGPARGLSPAVTSALLVASGAVTAIPLLFFVEAGKRLSLASLGFLQYISPSSQLGLAVFVFHESFDPNHLYAFFFIWVALAIYSVDLALHFVRVKRGLS